MSSKRLNIGFLISEFENDFTYDLCTGVFMAAQELDVNLVVYPGKYVNANFHDSRRMKFDYQNNSLFDYAALEQFDAVLLDMGTIGTCMSKEEQIEFVSKFKVPVIPLACNIPGYSCVCFDNVVGFRDGVRHMILEHGAKEIGFVSGPRNSFDANSRLEAFKEVLVETGIPFDEDRVVYGDFSRYSEELVNDLLDRYPNLDTMIFANDHMAVGGYNVFNERGLIVGKDIRVMGYDDSVMATSVEPNMTTVKADPIELGYQAVLNIQKLISQTMVIMIDSEFVIRESCGCNQRRLKVFDFNARDLLKKEQISDILEELYIYLFDRCNQQIGTRVIKERLAEYLFWVVNRILAGQPTERDWQKLNLIMREMAEMELEPYTDSSKLFHIFDTVFRMVEVLLEQDEDKVILKELYYAFYQDAALNMIKKSRAKRKDINWVNHITTTFNRDVLNYDVGDDNAYLSLSDKIKQLKYESFYLYLFHEPVEHEQDTETQIQEKMYLKTYLEDGKNSTVPTEEQEVWTANKILDLVNSRNRRSTIIVTILYSALKQYGLLYHELDFKYLDRTVAVNNQISSSVDTMNLLRKNKEANQILESLSKSDELTQIYNRRGFLSMVQSQVSNEKNKGKKAFIMYADMNNLKIINDKFGHEEGDYSLKTIAAILKGALSEGIVARFGGDEFAGFGFVDANKNSTYYKNKIAEITKMVNADNNKPFYVSMSVGVCDFVCNDKTDLEDLLSRADVDLYLEKKHKRNNVLKQNDV